MKLEVQLFATLAPYLPAADDAGRALIEVPSDATVSDALRALGIPEAMPRIVLINGHDAAEERRLEPDDVLTVFPPLAGGAHPFGARRGGKLGGLTEGQHGEASRNPVGLPDFKSGVRL